MESGAIIRADGLAKTFQVRTKRRGVLGGLRGALTEPARRVRAVQDISFTIAPGEIVGYIGPNGAGKSTTIKMLTGILVPTSGEATVAGFVPWKQRKELAQRIGVVFGQRTQLWWDLPLIDSLELLRFIYKVPEERFRRSLDRARELLELDAFLATPVRQLSLGQRMRGDLAAALLHGPPILYLDEPTIGLDVVAKTRIREFLAEINRERNVTILLTTHDLEDIERLCKRIIVIDHGQALYDGLLSTLVRRFGTTRELAVDFTVDAPDALDIFGGLPVTLVHREGPRARFLFARDAVSAAELITRLAALAPIRDVSLLEPDIDSIIRRIYEGEIDLTREQPVQTAT
jgi:ABC-2 type transport system ATP-binding protein